jgi:hypothetical protein
MGRRKDVLLFLLAVIALVVAVYTFRRPARAPVANPATAANPATSTKEVAKAGGETKTGQAADRTGTSRSAGGPTRSPFEGPGAAAVAESEAGRKPPVGAVAGLPQGPAPAVDPLPALPTLAPATAGSPKQATTPEKTLTLNGIVAGRQAMAVIRQGEQRYYVKVGDPVGDQYRVQTISQKEVVLVGKEGKVILRMGGRQ